MPDAGRPAAELVDHAVETTWTRCVRLTAWLKYREVCALNIEECVMCGFFNLPIGIGTNFTTQSVAKETLFPT